MEIFFLWLWLSLPTIFWVGLLALIVGSAVSAVLFFQWRAENHPLTMDYWYKYECPYSIHDLDQRRSAYEKYLKTKVGPGTPNPYKTKASVLLAVLLCWLVLVPSQKNVAFLVGASYALDVAKSPEAAKVTTILRSKVNDYLDAEIKAINQEKK